MRKPYPLYPRNLNDIFIKPGSGTSLNIRRASELCLLLEKNCNNAHAVLNLFHQF